MEGQQVVSEMVRSGGEIVVEETAAMEETLSADQGIEISPSSVDADVVNTVEVAAFQTPERCGADSSCVEEPVQETATMEVAALEVPPDDKRSSEHSNSGGNGSSSGGELEQDLALDCNGPLELSRVAGIHLVHVVDRSHSEPGAAAELLKGLAASSTTHPITTHSTTSSIAITWCLPDRDPGTIFQVETKLDTAVGWTLVYYGKATSYTMTGLPPGTDVGVRIQAVNLGISGWCCGVLCSTLPGPPGAPSAPAALNVGSSEIELGWRPPVQDGGPYISGFRLKVKELQQSAWRGTEDSHNRQQRVVTMLCGNNSRVAVKGLEPGATYCFQVQALNMLGDGPYSEPIVLKTCPAPPAIPEPPVVVNKTSKSVSLSWRFPLCNGAPVESFVLQMLVIGYGEKCLPACDDSNSASHYDLQGTIEDDSEHGVVFERSVDRPGSEVYDVYTGPGNDFVMKKLRPFSSYAFRVKAQNVAGSSGFSAFTTCMTSPASPSPPPPPTIVMATSSSLTLKWEIPDQDNGSPVLGYTLELALEMLKMGLKRETPLREQNLNVGKKLGKKKLGQQDAAVHLTTRVWEVVYDGHGLGTQFTDLSPGNEYLFRVKAQNALGTSSPSAILVAKTLPAAPGAPQPPTFSKVTPTSVQIKWSSPTCDNGMPVTSYRLMLDDGQGGQFRKVYEGESKLYNASKLVPSSSYYVAVQAINACGASDLSEVAVVELPEENLPISPSPTPALAPATVVVELPYKEKPASATVVVASPKKGRTAPAATVVVASPKKERPAPAATVVVASPKKERPAPAATVVVASPKKERPAAATDSIKSKQEVKELMRQKARHSWSQKVTKFIIIPGNITWLEIQQPWPLWARRWMYVGAVFVMLLLLKML